MPLSVSAQAIECPTSMFRYQHLLLGLGQFREPIEQVRRTDVRGRDGSVSLEPDSPGTRERCPGKAALERVVRLDRE